MSLNWKGKPGLRNLLWASLTEFTVCKECREQNWMNNSGTVVRLEIDQRGQNASTIATELHKVLHPKDKPSPCGQCKHATNKSVSTPSQELSDYLCLNIPRKVWNTKTNKMERLRHKIKPEKVLNIKVDLKKAKSLYSLAGGIIHLGEANSGHYLSILNASGAWYEIYDARVNEITDAEALQSLESNGVLLLYRRSLSPKKTEVVKGGSKGRRMPLEAHAQAPQKRLRNENKTRKPNPVGLRQRFPQLKGTEKAFKSGGTLRRDTCIPKGYYDPDKKCYYIPRPQN